MHPHRRLSALLAAVTAGALLLSGCSGTADEPQAAPEPTGTPEALAAVREAAELTEEAGSARYLLETATRVNGQDVVVSADGVYDWIAEKGRTTYQIPGGRVEQRLLGGTLFFVLPQQPGVFYRVPTAEVATTPLGGTVDPTAQLLVLAAATEAVEVGEEQVRDEPTTHYRGSYDLERAAELAQGQQRDALLSSLGAAVGAESAPFDAYLDEEGRLRRLVQTVEVPASTSGDGQPLSVTTTLELYDFGREVVVPGPPAEMIRDGAPLLAALRGALGGEPAASRPATPPSSPPG